MSISVRDITTLLREADGDRQAQDELYRLVETRLKQIAAHQMRGQAPDISLQATMLVDDAFGKLVADQQFDWRNREQFFCTASRVIRHLLVDHARSRQTAKRGGGDVPAALDAVAETVDRQSHDPQQLIELDDILQSLCAKHPETFKIFELHYFMGFELKEIAEDVLEMPYTTVKRRWSMAKAFLKQALLGEADE